MRDQRYSNGKPPYVLYQAENGLWGLKDCRGIKLPAVFNKIGEYYSCDEGEIVTFDPNDGFILKSYCVFDD